MSGDPAAAVWIRRLDIGRGPIRVAIKDLIDLAGWPTTAGSAAVAATAVPARVDAACLAGIRAAIGSGRCRIVGKTNLHELADGVTGINPWFGTPVNPADAQRVPGGSSSGSAVAVGAGLADVALGTDTGGSVRIPAACCGVAGLKTTNGRVSLDGVWPLAPSLDTVGPMARDVDGLVLGMALLEPGFAEAPSAATAGVRVGRLRIGTDDEGRPGADERLEAAVNAALDAAGLPTTPVALPGWRAAVIASIDLLGAEASELHGARIRADPAAFGADVVAGFAHAATVGRQRRRDAVAGRDHWRAEMARALDTVDVIALPTLADLPPVVSPGAGELMHVAWTIPVNLAGLPALALPVPLGAPARTTVPGSVQLIGRPGSEELLLAVGRRIQGAVQA